MTLIDQIVRVRVATIRHFLETPFAFGSWVFKHREFALVRIDAESGLSGFAYCLTRDGPVAEIVDRTVGPAYVGRDAADPEGSFYAALRSNPATHSAGVGMRALSVVDIAAWDLAAKVAGQDIATYLGGDRPKMPVTAIVGYPPTRSAVETADQMSSLWAAGWRRFKLPVSGSRELTLDRLRTAREALPDAWIGLDNSFSSTTAADAIEFAGRFEGFRLGWFEDIVPPGDAALVAEIRSKIATPVAMGDEQGGSYHPQALLAFSAVDFLRVDATTNGGITRLRGIVADAAAEGIPVAPHMFPHVHSQIAGALGIPDAPIEWGIPGTGVHPMDDSLPQPEVCDGFMAPLPARPGFGQLVDLEWISAQEVRDEDSLLSGIQ